MEFVRAATEAEVLACWVRAETDSERSGGALATARTENPDASDAELLAATRGWPDRDYFTGFPSDIQWSLVRLSAADLRGVRYINWEYWLDVSGGTRLATDAARRMAWTDGLLPSKFEPLILLTDPAATKLVVVEGHSRLTGYVISGDRLTDLTDCYLGVSPEASAWGCF